VHARQDVQMAVEDGSMLAARDARAAAQQRVGDALEARVLEPSPPAVVDGNWFADDPVAIDSASGRPVVSPVPGADVSWDTWVRDHPEDASWIAARWLGAYRRLPRLPATLPETRLALHRVAVYVVSPARRRVNGKLGLRWTFGGIGTPFFGDDEQVRIAGTHLVRQRAGSAWAAAIGTLGHAAAFVLDGPPDVEWAEPFDVPPAGNPDDELRVDTEAAGFLANWYGFAYSVLEWLRAEPESTETSRVQLWPEHFDAAFDSLPGAGRATFGASPGDAAIDAPYLYVLPADFDAVRESDVWNADTFNGAVLRIPELVAAPDQRAEALTFFRCCRDVLRALGG